jgi:energy-coupling factor transporter transmembrane protein EcfT
LRALLKGAAMVNWDRLLPEAKTFFSSGLFFMLLGGLIIYFGNRLSNDPFTHSAFVFLVVILGLALFLFGTGTSASGEGTSGQVKVAIAGGAGVLAMVLGFGVAHWREDLTDVFA